MGISSLAVSACGGDDGAVGSPASVLTQQSASGQQFESNSLSTAGKNSVAIDKDYSVRKSAWVNLSSGSMGIAMQELGRSATIQSSDSVNPAIQNQFDGVIVNADEDFGLYKEKVSSALNEGYLIIIDSSGSADSQQRVLDLSIELAHVGRKAAVALLYKGAPDEGVGVLAFDAAERDELATLLPKLGRRGSDSLIKQKTQ
ncbi:hypothetical protein E6L39_39605 [Burkholderia cepacia]|uniref:hypothetical protein n=1 Tax=Burkholderia cepacia TaxID=292 RepID=UPI001067D7EA|nr:hypothetical protein [Burkholderia cepacia]TEU31023.1 hypothetical protein E3D39_40170 [Burkholderia cepacia]TEU62679.1 hypothetical protein E3D42_40270 [Burkholderia cepacia]TEU64009.1 hypothetical protein E3D04_34200 [Burkholderia cepacia]TEU82428.1 hypothetical protein E3D43_40330 [Burkholderia cepacia]TEU84034.1 hypothetical protein E3D40_43610 [Burkholderia cepacia]